MSCKTVEIMGIDNKNFRQRQGPNIIIVRNGSHSILFTSELCIVKAFFRTEIGKRSQSQIPLGTFPG